MGSIGVAHARALLYGSSPDKKAVVAGLCSKARATGPANVYLATDPDREGKAMRRHWREVPGLVARVTHCLTFQETTELAIKAALALPP